MDTSTYLWVALGAITTFASLCVVRRLEHSWVAPASLFFVAYLAHAYISPAVQVEIITTYNPDTLLDAFYWSFISQIALLAGYGLVASKLAPSPVLELRPLFSSVGAAIAAVALGACIYERHLVLESDSDAIDRAVSSTPEELRSLIEAMERVRVALGDGRKVCQPAEQPNLIPSRRGLYAARSLKAGSRVGPEDVMVVRPATTLPPSHLPGLIGSVLTRDVDAGSAFLAADIRMERAS